MGEAKKQGQASSFAAGSREKREKTAHLRAAASSFALKALLGCRLLKPQGFSRRKPKALAKRRL